MRRVMGANLFTNLHPALQLGYPSLVALRSTQLWNPEGLVDSLHCAFNMAVHCVSRRKQNAKRPNWCMSLHGHELGLRV